MSLRVKEEGKLLISQRSVKLMMPKWLKDLFVCFFECVSDVRRLKIKPQRFLSSFKCWWMKWLTNLFPMRQLYRHSGQPTYLKPFLTVAARDRRSSSAERNRIFTDLGFHHINTKTANQKGGKHKGRGKRQNKMNGGLEIKTIDDEPVNGNYHGRSVRFLERFLSAGLGQKSAYSLTNCGGWME